MNLKVNFNILKQFNCALIGLIKDLIPNTRSQTFLIDVSLIKDQVSNSFKTVCKNIVYFQIEDGKTRLSTNC